MTLNHETETFDQHLNERAKLKNAWSMINWYCHRFALLYKIAHSAPVKRNGTILAPKNIIPEMEKQWQKAKFFPQEIKEIIVWSRKFQYVTPNKANKLFYDTWIFLHNYELTLHENVEH